MSGRKHLTFNRPVAERRLTTPLIYAFEWIENNVPETAKADVVSIGELTHKLFSDAKAIGIKREEIDEEVDSLYRTLRDWMVHFEPGISE